MTFPMAKTPNTQLTFIVQAEIRVQEASPKEKKVKEHQWRSQWQKKTPSQLTKPKSKSRKRPLKKKKEKGTLMMFLMAKTPNFQLIFIVQAEIQVQEASPKEKKVKKR